MNRRKKNEGEHISSEVNVISRHRGLSRLKVGRGYSTQEIFEAFRNIGVTSQNISKARAFGLRVDMKRKSAHQQNVTNLTAVLKKHEEAARPEASSKKRGRTKKKSSQNQNI